VKELAFPLVTSLKERSASVLMLAFLQFPDLNTHQSRNKDCHTIAAKSSAVWTQNPERCGRAHIALTIMNNCDKHVAYVKWVGQNCMHIPQQKNQMYTIKRFWLALCI
jgi:hypothetical protein